MINLYSQHPTSSFVFYPDTDFTEVSGSEYRLDLTQSLDQSTAEVTSLQRLNTNTSNSKSAVIVLQAFSGSGVPSYDGQYTAKLKYGFTYKETWGESNYLFGSYNYTFGNPKLSFSSSYLGTDRAYVHGTNLQTITNYTSPNENGAYTTYNS